MSTTRLSERPFAPLLVGLCSASRTDLYYHHNAQTQHMAYIRVSVHIVLCCCCRCLLTRHIHKLAQLQLVNQAFSCTTNHEVRACLRRDRAREHHCHRPVRRRSQSQSCLCWPSSRHIQMRKCRHLNDARDTQLTLIAKQLTDVSFVLCQGNGNDVEQFVPAGTTCQQGCPPHKSDAIAAGIASTTRIFTGYPATMTDHYMEA